jgi:hypothetical protein
MKGTDDDDKKAPRFGIYVSKVGLNQLHIQLLKERLQGVAPRKKVFQRPCHAGQVQQV